MIPDEIKNLPDNPCNEKKIFRDCPDCDGDREKLSDCCGSPGISNGDGCSEDYGICPECGDHADLLSFICEFTACETCGGTGEVEMTYEEIQDMKDNESEYLYDVNKSEK